MALKTISATDKPFTSAIGLQPIWSTQNTQGQIPTRGLGAENIVNENFSIIEENLATKAAYILGKADKTVIYNITQATGVTYTDKTTARNAIAASLIGLGQLVTYKLTTGWVTEQYIGADVSGWGIEDNWRLVDYHRITNSAKYVGVVSDLEGRILQGFTTSGTPFFPKNELLIKTDSPLYAICICDAEDRLLFGIKKDGTTYIAKLSGAMTNSERELLQLLTEVLIVKDNSKNIYHISDASDRVLMYFDKSGTPFFPKNELLYKSNHPDYLFFFTDIENRIIGFIKKDGTVYFPKLELTENNYKSINERNPIVRSLTDVIVLPIPTTLATVSINSDRMSELTVEKNTVPATMQYNDHNGNSLTINVEIAWQGSSSINNPKKNFSIDLSNKLQFGNWVAQDGFHFKSDYMDATRSRNNVCAQLVNQVYATRSWLTQRPWRAPYTVNDTSMKNRFDTGAKGCIAGFLFELFINGDYQGLYNFNMKKHRDNYQMDKSNNNHILMEMAGGNQSMISYPVDYTKWEIRNPKGFKPNATPADGVVKTSIERFFSWASSVTNANFNAQCDQYMNIPFWIDFVLIKQLMAALDWDKNNTLIGTHDGLRWSPYMYDADSIIGLYALGTVINDGLVEYPSLGQFQNVEKVLQSVKSSDINARYKELRDSGIFTTENIVDLFNKRLLRAGYDALDRDLKKWWETPSNRDGSKTYPSPPMYTGGSFTGIGQIADWLDKRLLVLDTKYNY